METFLIRLRNEPGDSLAGFLNAVLERDAPNTLREAVRAAAARSPGLRYAIPASVLAGLSDGVTARNRHVPVNAAGQIILLVLMWIIVVAAPMAVQESRLPAEIQQTLDDYYGLLAGLAVSITFLVAPKLMKKTPKK